MTALDPFSGTTETVNLGPLTDLPVGQGRAFAVGDRQIALFRLRDGRVVALDAVCPDKGGPLADAQLDGRVIVCPLHQHAFELETGRCTTSGGVADVRSYPVPLRDDATIDVEVT